MIAQERGRLDEAGDWYRKSLAIEEEVGNRSGMAMTYGQLGLLARLGIAALPGAYALRALNHASRTLKLTRTV